MIISIVIPYFNQADYVFSCIDSICAQNVPEGVELIISIIDDGSTDDSAEIIRSRYGQKIRLYRLLTNQGRSSARNYGAEASANADFLIFIDSDCIPTGSRFLESYCEAMRSGSELIFGQVSTHGTCFWDLLQQDAFKNRKSEFENGRFWAYTTQNVGIKRELFLRSGGFDALFERHGFEDRDLFIRLINLGARPSFCPSANVIHDDKITLSSVASKMLAAGLHSSLDFSSRHPEQYQNSHYARIDCHQHPWLKWLDRLVWPIASIIAKTDSSWLESRAIPLRMRVIAARLVYGLHYMHGTALAAVNAETS